MIATRTTTTATTSHLGHGINAHSVNNHKSGTSPRTSGTASADSPYSPRRPRQRRRGYRAYPPHTRIRNRRRNRRAPFFCRRARCRFRTRNGSARHCVMGRCPRALVLLQAHERHAVHTRSAGWSCCALHAVSIRPTHKGQAQGRLGPPNHPRYPYVLCTAASTAAAGRPRRAPALFSCSPVCCSGSTADDDVLTLRLTSLTDG